MLPPSPGCITTNPARGSSPNDGPGTIQITHSTTELLEYGTGIRERVPTTTWQYLQGTKEIDEQDWWQLTDPQVSEEIRRPVGIVVGGGGGVAMAVAGGSVA